MFGLETDIFILLAFSILAACAFEFVNGFHDTANAVATVIYTGMQLVLTGQAAPADAMDKAGAS